MRRFVRTLAPVSLGLFAASSLGCGPSPVGCGPAFTDAVRVEADGGAGGSGSTGSSGAGGTSAVCPVSCAAADDCHVSTCDVASKACAQAAAPDGTPCAAVDACSIGGVCTRGACLPMPRDCSSLNDACNRGRCDPALGCVKESAFEGAACDDGLFCTIDDACKHGTCTGAPNVCGETDPCFTTTCDETQKSCESAAGNDGAACVSPDKCSVGTSCSMGTCGDPKFVITQCLSGDGCCPPGCTKADDSDCP